MSTSGSLPQAARITLRRTSWAAFGAASVFLFAANVHADSSASRYLLGYQQYSTTVSFGDLDLSRTSDAQVLYSRLRAAAKSVCGTADARNLRMRNFAFECYQQSLSNAVSDISNANVTALHAADPSIRVAQRVAPPTGRT
jgi:UrcA family protein